MRFVILIVVALGLAGAFVFMSGGNQGQAPAQIDDGEYVLVATRDLLPGSFIKVYDSFKWVDIENGKYAPEVQAKFMRKNATNLQEIEGAVVRRFMGRDEPIDRDYIVAPGEGGFMSAVLYPGMRAISIGVNVVSGNAGFIFPGDRVDLLLTHRVEGPDGGESYATETFVEDVRVLAIDQQVNNPDRKAVIAKTVTLEVLPKQAEQVLVAEELGKISLILRSMGANKFAEGDDGSKKSYTRDDEVSKVIERIRPVEGNVRVTITRGKNADNIDLEAVR